MATGLEDTERVMIAFLVATAALDGTIHRSDRILRREVSMLAAPTVDRRISRRWASRLLKKRAGFSAIGRLQDTATNRDFDSCGSSSSCQVAAFTDNFVGRGSKCRPVVRSASSRPR